MKWRGRHVALAVGLALTAGAAAVLADDANLARHDSPLAPAVEPARPGTKCIADTDYMRRHHMELLRHQRDDTVHKGIRGAQASLQGCISCHASTRTGSVVKAPTDFCVQCHSYAAVKIDCFDCHAGTPAAPTVAGATSPEAR